MKFGKSITVPICVWIIAFTASSIVSRTHAQQRNQHYIVKLRDESLIRHLARSATGRMKEQMASPEAASYRVQIQSRHASLRRSVEALPQGQVRAEFSTLFNGMAVSLRPQDVDTLRQNPLVDYVVPSVQYHKLLDAAIPLVNGTQAWANSRIGGEGNAGAGVKIGVIDTGIDINHPMLQDSSLVPPGGYPKFTNPTAQCNNSDQRFTNSKVIVARNYVTLLDGFDPNCDAEDRDGHGTFVSAIAAGHRVSAPLASISGVAPKAFLGSYKVFGTPGINDNASEEAILQAVEDAVADGMDVINLSLGAPTTDLPASDPLDQAVAAAVLKGVTVVVAAGNDGPATGTISSPGTSPSVITVGATTNSRTLANPLIISASTPVPDNLQRIGAIMGTGAKPASDIGPVPVIDVSSIDKTGLACTSLPGASLSGDIVLVQRGICNFSVKIQNAYLAGAVAVIVYNNVSGQPGITMDVGTATQIPSAMIGNTEGLALLQFLRVTSGVLATFQARQGAIPVAANRLADFTSGGPSTDLGLKPDLVAPGTDIYSAAQRNFPAGVQYDPSGFSMFSGTSFSTPMVAGAAALVKQANPGFTPAQIKSALVNTAAKIVSTAQGANASMLSAGNGLLDIAAALNTEVTASPVSLSFGAQAPGTQLSSSTTLTITNITQAADTFTFTATSTFGAPLSISATPASLSLAPGASGSVTINASSSAALNGTVEGYVSIQGQNSQAAARVPYWGAFLQPSVYTAGAVNAASYSYGPSSLAAGEIISIFGTGLANTIESATSQPLPLSLGGVSVTLGGQPVPLLYASPGQINGQVPFELAGRRSAQLIVSIDGLSSPPQVINLSPAAPGIYTTDQSGHGTGAIVHASDASFVTADNPARPGEFLEIFATGLGTTTPSVTTATAASSTPVSTSLITPSVTIGSVSARVTFSGLAPNFVGLYQVNVQVPDGIPAGAQTLVLTANGISSNPVTVAIGN